jgi:hypothetical protein
MTLVSDPHSLDLHATTMIIRPWVDPMLDSCGHDASGKYVELFWLGVLGPSATWLLRRMVAGLDEYPDGYELDLPATAGALGLTFNPGKHSPFSRALQRTLFFGIAHQAPGSLHVRRKVPPVTRRQLERMPEHLQAAHPFWLRSPTDVETAEYTRAQSVAEALDRIGDDTETIERRLSLLGIDPMIATMVLRTLHTHPVVT